MNEKPLAGVAGASSADGGLAAGVGSTLSAFKKENEDRGAGACAGTGAVAFMKPKELAGGLGFGSGSSSASLDAAPLTSRPPNILKSISLDNNLFCGAD